MEKLLFIPTFVASRRRIRTQAEWKVMTHIALARGPTSSSTRSRISAAALLVKVIARISPGSASPVRSRWAMRRVSTRVFPEPAPATISSGLPRCSTASRWAGFSPSTSSASPGPSARAGAGRGGTGTGRSSTGGSSSCGGSSS